MPSIYRGFAENVVITTHRLILRPKKMSDATDIFFFESDPEVAKFAFPVETTLEGTKEYIAESMKNPLGKYAICLKEGGQVIGVIDFIEIDVYARAGAIGYTLNRQFWGREFATEALHKLLEIGFEQIGFLKIIGEHDVRNVASGRVMEKAGMIRKNTYKKQDKWTKKIEEFTQYELTKNAYKHQKQRELAEEVRLFQEL